MDYFSMKKQASAPHNPQSGSIFVWIFIMIALFGALSYAMLQGSRSGSGTLTQEKARLVAAEMVDYSNKIETAVKTLRISNSCAETQLAFDNTLWKQVGGSMLNPPGHNPTTPADGRCNVFSGTGGALNAVTFPDNGIPEISGNFMSGHGWIARVKMNNVGDTAKEDIVAWFAYVDKNTCIEINKLLGVDNPNGLPPEDILTPVNHQPYNGVFTEAAGALGQGSLAGKKNFCFHWDSGGTSAVNAYDYHYVKVLWSR